MSWITRLFSDRRKPQITEFSDAWREVLNKKVQFYRSLHSKEQARFEEAVLVFLSTTKITGIKTTVDDVDHVLIGASAIIPIFAFKNWRYHNLHEVLVYPEHFKFKPKGSANDVNALGMVGFGYMEGKMILSKKALRIGFRNEKDKHNTAVHEFVHLIDKMDGKIDGVMKVLMEKSYALPWINLMDKKIQEILESESDIRPYGATNRAEFLAVASEYFFERPHLLKDKHPELFHHLEKMFRSKITNRALVKKSAPTRHFDPCPCDSGKKFKDCCM